MRVCVTQWTCFDTILALKQPLSASVTMGPRLERTQVTLCGSNTELIHSALPPWEFHMATASSRRSVFSLHTILLFFHDTLVSTYTKLWTQTHSESTSDIFQFYSRMFTGKKSGFWLLLFKVEPCNYKFITPVWRSCFFSFVPAVFPLSHQASLICGFTLLWLLGSLTAHHSCISCCQANNSFLMVHNINGNRSAH